MRRARSSLHCKSFSQFCILSFSILRKLKNYGTQNCRLTNYVSSNIIAASITETGGNSFLLNICPHMRDVTHVLSN